MNTIHITNENNNNNMKNSEKFPNNQNLLNFMEENSQVKNSENFPTLASRTLRRVHFEGHVIISGKIRPGLVDLATHVLADLESKNAKYRNEWNSNNQNNKKKEKFEIIFLSPEAPDDLMWERLRNLPEIYFVQVKKIFFLIFE